MAYRIESGLWGGVFAVPNQVVDQYIKLCGAVSLKVLMLLLRHGGAIEPEEMAGILGQPVCEIQDALNYWFHMGVIAGSQDSARDVPLLQYHKEPPPRAVETETVVEKPGSTRKRLSTQEINEMAEADDNIANLLQETQSVLGKPLTPVTTDMVVGLYSYYGMRPDLILMLVQYCVSGGKDNARYIEKVAATWLEKGIDTHEKAEEEILRATKRSQWENTVKSAFGIYDRKLITSEKKYIGAWRDELNLDIHLISLAYERTIELKGKLSFPYINGILQNWHQKGITTVADATREIGGGGKQSKEKKPQAATSYDLEELEKMIVSGDYIK